MRLKDKIRKSIFMLLILIITLSVVLKVVYGGNVKHFSFDFFGFRNKVIRGGNTTEGGETCSREVLGKESESNGKKFLYACKTGTKFGAKSLKKNTPDYVSEKVSEFRRQVSLGQKMCAALDAGNYELVKEIIVKHPELANFTNEEETPIFVNVAKSNRKDLMELFLSLGADPNGKDKDGVRVIWLAVRSNCIDNVKLLLDKGAQMDYEATEIKDFTNRIYESELLPLQLAIYRNGNPEMVRLLLSRGAEVDKKNCKGCTALFYSVYPDHPKITELLVEKGADVNTRTNTGRTPLFFVRDLKTAMYLVACGADVNAIDGYGNTAFHFAVGTNNTIVAEYLISKGAVVNTTGRCRRTPLHDVTDLVLAKYILNHGGDVTAKDIEGNTPLHLVFYRCWDKSGKLDEYSKELTLLYLSRGADINGVNNYGMTPLHYATLSGNMALIRLLISKGAKMNIRDNDGRMPVNYSVDKALPKSFIALLQGYISRNWLFRLVIFYIMLQEFLSLYRELFLRQKQEKKTF